MLPTVHTFISAPWKKTLHRSQWDGRRENICHVLSLSNIYMESVDFRHVPNASQKHLCVEGDPINKCNRHDTDSEKNDSGRQKSVLLSNIHNKIQSKYLVDVWYLLLVHNILKADVNYISVFFIIQCTCVVFLYMMKPKSQVCFPAFLSKAKAWHLDYFGKVKPKHFLSII